MAPRARLRLILDGPRPAALNMAVDELLMEQGAPALRFYGWERPSVTIGYFDDVQRAAKALARKGERLEVVRRITGGGAVRHDRDLTFSLVLPVPSPYFAPDVKSSYLRINEAVRVGLREEHPSMDYADCRTVPSQSARQKQRVCFDAPSCYDLLLEGKKVLGGSQRRKGGVMLHQSTLFLAEPPGLLARRIREGFEKVWNVSFEERPLDPGELALAAKREEAIRADGSRLYLAGGSFLREAIFLS